MGHTCARPPTPQAAWVHQIHAAGGASSSTTMVMVFVILFVLFVRFLTRDSSVTCCTYILEVLQSGPPRLAPYRSLFFKMYMSHECSHNQNLHPKNTQHTMTKIPPTHGGTASYGPRQGALVGIALAMVCYLFGAENETTSKK